MPATGDFAATMGWKLNGFGFWEPLLETAAGDELEGGTLRPREVVGVEFRRSVDEAGLRGCDCGERPSSGGRAAESKLCSSSNAPIPRLDEKPGVGGCMAVEGGIGSSAIEEE